MLSLSNEYHTQWSSLGVDGTRPVATQGTSVTPGGTNTYGAYASLGVPSATDDMYEIELNTQTVNVAAENRMVMVMVGVDPAGGTAFVDTWKDIFVGGATNAFTTNQHQTIRLPFMVRAGSSLGVKAASLNATVTAIKAWINTVGKPRSRELIRVGKFVRTFGVTSPTVAGVAITPGTTLEGAYAEIGTLADPLWYFDFGMVVDDTTITAAVLVVDIALGDATNKRVIISNALVWTTAGESVFKGSTGAWANGASSDKIYARAQSNTTLDTGYSIAVYGVGG